MNDIYDLVIQMEESLAEDYSGDEFYSKSVRILSEHGYDLERENIMEIHEADPGSKEEYLEVVGEFVDENRVSSYLSFVLEDSEEKGFRPSVEFTSGLEDTSSENV